LESLLDFKIALCNKPLKCRTSYLGIRFVLGGPRHATCLIAVNIRTICNNTVLLNHFFRHRSCSHLCAYWVPICCANGTGSNHQRCRMLWEGRLRGLRPAPDKVNFCLERNVHFKAISCWLFHVSSHAVPDRACVLVPLFV